MSDKEDKSSNDEESTGIKQDGGVKNLEPIFEGNVTDSIKIAEDSSAISENMPRLEALGSSGDDPGHILVEDSKSNKIESELKEIAKEFTMTDAGKESGDETTQTKVSDLDDKKIEDINTDIDLNDTKSSKTDVISEKDESDSSLNKQDEVEPEQLDDSNDYEDDDIKLTWDDDDNGSNEAVCDDKINLDAKIDDVLSEEQLLEEPSDAITKEMSEMHSNGNSKPPDNNLESDLLKDSNEENSLTRDKTSKDIETTNKSEISPKLNIPTEKFEDVNTSNILENKLFGDTDMNAEMINSPEMDFPAEESQKMSPGLNIPAEKLEDENISNILEDKLLGDSDMNAEMINSPEMDFSAEESLDQNDINIRVDKLLEESEINIIATEIDKVEEITVEKDKNKSLKETETAKTNLLKEVPSEDQTKEDLDDIIEDDKLLTESESNTETVTPTFKMSSFTDVIFNKESDSIIGSGHVPEKVTESSGIVSINKDIEGSNDLLLEEKLLEETELAEAIPDIDVTMEVDDEKEEELLREDECQDDSCTPMDVDFTDPSVENQVTMDDKIVDQSMVAQSDMELKDAVHQIDDETKIEKVNVDQTIHQIRDMDQSDDVAKTTDTVIDSPIEDTTKTVDTNKDTTIEEQSQIVDITKVTTIENKANIEEKFTTDTVEKVGHQLFDNKNSKEDIKHQGSAVESYSKTQSVNSSEQSDTLTVSNIPNVVIEEIERSTSEKETENKKELQKPELTTDSVNPDNHFDVKIEADEISANISFATENPDKTLNRTHDADEYSPNNSSLFLEDPPIRIKTDHGLHKPDVMLEIPTQELIDMDDTDFSMNLDQSEVVDSTNDAVDDVEHEKIVDKLISLDEDVVLEKIVDKMTAFDKDIETEKTIADNITVGDITADKIIAEVGTVNEKSVDPEAAVTENTIDKLITDDVTVNEKAVVQKAVVTEPTVSKVQTGDIVESTSDKKPENTIVQATIEENMKMMFASNEQDVVTKVPECISTATEPPEPVEQASTSITRMTPDTSDEVPDISDSLGLLAESSGRMMEDDEDDDDVDEDDDFDNDESSNQISAEQSEDSNPAALESEPPRDQEGKDLETPDPKDLEFPFMISCVSATEDIVEKMDVEVEEYGTLQLQAESINQMSEETKSAVDALLRDNANDQVEDQQEATEQMDIETVKLSDTSDNEIDVGASGVEGTVAEPSKEVVEEQQKKSPSKSPSKSNVSPKESPSKLRQSPCKQSPSKMKNLAITAQEPSSVLNIVYLEESSSEDDIQEVQKRTKPETTPEDKPPSPDSDVTNVNIPTGIEIMCTSGGNTSEITTKEGEVVISGVPKPPPHKPARLNTSEVSIKTVSTAEPMVIPETKMNDQTQTATQPKHKLSLEIFSLDSDEEDSAAKETSEKTSPNKITALELDKARETSKCINYCCKSDNTVPYKVAEPSVVAFYDGGRKRRSMVCQPCADVVANRTMKLMQGIKDMGPLLDLDMAKSSQDLVEISDSESEDEDITPEKSKECIGETGAKFIEDNLAKYLNKTWLKYEMDVRLKETQIMLDDEIEKLEQDSKEIDAMLNECQIATDKLRNELYATFECRRQHLPALVLYDTPESKFIGLEKDVPPPTPAPVSIETRQAKRRLSSTSESPAKRPAIPLGYAPLDAPDSKEKAAIPAPDTKIDDDKDISVVKLSAEAAPADLPPPGEISRPPLRVSMPVYAMKNAFGPWLKGRVLEIQPKNPSGGNPFSLCRVKFDHKTKTNGKVLPARCIAYSEPADVRMTIGTRLIALFKDSNKRESYYSGVVAEIPNPVNNYRYLVFFDDGYAQYVQHQFTRLVCESSFLVWEEVHPFSREFVREYLMAYPERPMVRLHEGQHLKTEWNGKWWSSRVTRVDASLAQVMFVGDGRREWIYRGSTRLAPLYLELRAAERHRVRPMPRSKAQPRFNMPYVEYTRSEEQEANKQAEPVPQQEQQQQNDDIRRQRAVAKKSTSVPPQVLPPSQQIVPNHMDPVTSRVVYYTPKNAVKPLRMVTHRCSPKCKRSDVLSLKELRTYNPLAKPLLSGWERQIIRFKGHKEVMYRAPCGRRLRNMRELHHYLRTVDSDLPVDLFDFHYSTHCLAEFVLNKCLVGKKDLSHGKENVPVPCVNYYDDSLPEFCSYNTERTPTAGVPLNLAPEFLCGCDCTDDCQDKSKCACWKMTLEGARTIGLHGTNMGYVYKRLPEPLPSGIYECNSRCKCKNTCLNRVAQHPLQLKLQVFKTPNRGWGIRALNDVPKGSFLCVYAGNLLTDATANLDGLNEGDEYLAELDYIEVVEQMKEGYEEDIPDADKKLDKKDGKNGDDSDEDDQSSSEEEDTASKTDKEDDDFRPGYIGLGVTEFSKRLRRREKSKKDKENRMTDEKDKDTSNDASKDNKDASKDAVKDANKDTKEANAEEDCITISDDEEVREPSRFMVQENMKSNEYISKYKSVRTLFGKDEACYIMDAKVQGNIGRYLNHSCCPNVFVQNVFVDTHDPRFPWVAFFALSHIKAGTELTWNYNYDVGSVPGKILYCYCGAPNCRGRLL